jgi:hypothetical protein
MTTITVLGDSSLWTPNAAFTPLMTTLWAATFHQERRFALAARPPYLLLDSSVDSPSWTPVLQLVLCLSSLDSAEVEWAMAFV